MTTIDMNNRKTGNVPSETDMLRERFLAGETTREDEARLYALLDRPGATAEELALMSIIRPPSDSYDTEAWLTEDESQTYYEIVAGRKRRWRTMTGWAAAAVVAGIVFLTGLHIGRNDNIVDNTDNNIMTAHVTATVQSPAVAAPTPADSPAPSQEKTERTTDWQQPATGPQPATGQHRNNGPISTAGQKTQLMAQAAAPSSTADAQKTAAAAHETAGMTAADSMTMLIERMERDLDNLSDSVYLAHVEQIIRTDERFQKLIGKILINNMNRQNTPEEAYNINNK
ncbi:MAG: hypothetical protein IJ355_02405 [Prevotella sp.]|nr:hypothetical protein [Prevotella sp.]